LLTISEFKSVISTTATSGSKDQELTDAEAKVENATQSYNTFISELIAILSAYCLVQAKKKDVMEWISVGIPTSRHDGFSKLRVDGSGTWFVESEEFKDWVKGVTQVLIGSGSGSTRQVSYSNIRGCWKVLYYVPFRLETI
jgi:hypothetical protein